MDDRRPLLRRQVPGGHAPLSPTLAGPLRDALLAADFAYDTVAELLGAEAHAALSRNETTPGARRTASAGTPLATLVRLFLLQRAVPVADAERALPGLVDRLTADGLLARTAGEVVARLDCRPYATDDGTDLWVVSDLTPGLDGGPQQVGGDLVLDVGGWASPWPRADWVIDLMPYRTRGLYGRPDPDEERFSAETWVERDICASQPWPFADDQFDFAVCSHTLEDVRDPVRVCAELNRVARAGYLEVPSRLEEQSWGVFGEFAGWGHHHWLVDVTEAGIEFVFKHHVLHGDEQAHFPAGFASTLGPEQRVQQLWWQGSFDFRERIFTDAAGLDGYLREFVTATRAKFDTAPSPGRRDRTLNALLGRRPRRR